MTNRTDRAIKAARFEPKIPIGTEMFLPNHSGIASHPEVKNRFMFKNALDQTGQIDTEFTSSGGVRINFGTKVNPDLYMEIGAFSSVNNIDTKARDFKIFSTDVDNIIYIEEDTGNVGIGTATPAAKLDLRDGDIELTNGRIHIKTLVNDRANLRLAFGDGDTGFYESVDDTLQFVAAGDPPFNLRNTSFTAQFGATILNEQPSRTNPNQLPLIADINTGAGHDGATNNDRFSLITGGVEAIFMDENQNVLINSTGEPVCTLDVNGGFAANVVTKTSAYTATTSDFLIKCDASGGDFTVTLPAASGVSGLILNIKNTVSGVVTVDGNASETIDGSTTVTVNNPSNLQIMCDGSNWIVI